MHADSVAPTPPVGRRAHFEAEQAQLASSILADRRLVDAEVDTEARAAIGDKAAVAALRDIAGARARLPTLEHRLGIVNQVLGRLGDVELAETARTSAQQATQARQDYLGAVARFRDALLAAVDAGAAVVTVGRHLEALRTPVDRARDLELSDAAFPLSAHELEVWRQVAVLLKAIRPHDLNRPALFLQTCAELDLPVAKGRR